MIEKDVIELESEEESMEVIVVELEEIERDFEDVEEVYGNFLILEDNLWRLDFLGVRFYLLEVFVDDMECGNCF